MTRRAIVVGGSIGGLFTALVLRQRGWDVQVCERAGTPLHGRGAGIVTHPALWRALEQVGLDPHRDFGVRVERRVTLGADGDVVGRRACPQVLTSWDQVFRMLRGAWPDARYALGAELVGVEDRGGTVVARFADGAAREAELLVGADGIRSAARRLCVGEVAPVYAGYVAWRGMVEEADVPAGAHAALFDAFGFCLPPGEQMLGYPVAGEGNELRAGRRRYNFVWYRPADADGTLPGLLTDAGGRVHEGSIPPPLIRSEVVAAMRADAERVLAPQFAAMVRATRQPFLQPIYDLETPMMAAGRMALVGDAAFVTRPHLGAGVTKAAEDGLALAAAVEGDVADGLARYASERGAEGRRLVGRARALGAYMQAVLATPSEREAAERHHTPEAVMAETALLAF